MNAMLCNTVEAPVRLLHGRSTKGFASTSKKTNYCTKKSNSLLPCLIQSLDHRCELESIRLHGKVFLNTNS